MQTTPTYDTVVVGAGMSGLFTTLRLAQSGQSVALFEMSDRIGGRVETVLMGDKNRQEKEKFKAEFGPMRFEKHGQKNLRALMDELELTYTPFPPYQSGPTKWPKYDITDPDEKDKNPLHLLMMGILKILGEYEPGMDELAMKDRIWRLSEDNCDYEFLRRTKKQDKILLHERGFWNALSDVLSHQAVLKIRDTGNFYHLIPDNPNAIEWIIFWLRGLQPDDELVGIKGGSRMLPMKLMEKIKECGLEDDIFLKHKLIQLIPEGDRVRLRFEGKTKEVLAERVILAMPKSPLLKLSSSFPKKIHNMLDSVIAFPLLKCFFVTRKPWWNENTPPQTLAGTMPTREVHYYIEHVFQIKKDDQQACFEELRAGKPGPYLKAAFSDVKIDLPEDMISIRNGETGWRLYSSSHRAEHNYFVQNEDFSVFDKNGDGMVMVYTDRPASEYWNDYVVDRLNHDRAEIDKNPKLIGRFLKYLKDGIVAQLTVQKTERESDNEEQALFRAPFEHIRSEEELMETISRDIITYGLRDWGLDPYGAGCHAWRPNFKSWEVMKQVQAFGLEGADPGVKNVHICGEAYSEYQGFIEGALRTAEDVLKIILSTNPA